MIRTQNAETVVAVGVVGVVAVDVADLQVVSVVVITAATYDPVRAADAFIPYLPTTSSVVWCQSNSCVKPNYSCCSHMNRLISCDG